MTWFRRKRKPFNDGINERWEADMARVAEIEEDDSLSVDEKRDAQIAVMSRNNGGQPHGLRNVWTGPVEPPSGFGYYDVYGRRNR